MGNSVRKPACLRPPASQREDAPAAVAEVHKYTRPNAPVRGIDLRRLRALIVAGKLAPCFPGQDEPSVPPPPGGKEVEECPICFLVRSCSAGVGRLDASAADPHAALSGAVFPLPQPEQVL